MPILLTTPIEIKINEIGDIFTVEEVKFNFSLMTSTFVWKIKTQQGKVLKQGNQTLEKEDFVSWYNNDYTTHASLVSKAASLAGYVGVFNNDILK